MPALANEPWRGRARVVVREALAQHDIQVDFDGGGMATGDASAWSGGPGGTLTLTMGVGVTGSLTNPYQTYTVEVFLPNGGASLGGATWSVAAQPNNGGGSYPHASRQFRFDINPLNLTDDEVRAGMVEIVLTLHRTGQATGNHTINSRGQTTGTVPTGTAFDWARGYARAHNNLQSVGTSRVAAGGAATTDLAFGDSVFSRVTWLAQWYRAGTFQFHHLRGASFARTASVTAAAAVQDFQFSGASNSASRRVDALQATERYNLAAEQVGQQISMPETLFGIDREFRGGLAPAGWTVGTGALSTPTSGVTVDPRLTVSPHLQVNLNTFSTPPSTRAVATRQRQASDLGFIAARFTNARGDGQNLLSFSYSLRDAESLVAAKTASGTTSDQGGEAGWGSLMSWDAGLPGGNWVNTITVTDGAGTQISNDTSSTFALLAVDPRIATIVGAGSAGNQADHFIPGSPLIIGASFVNRSTGVGVTPDPGSVRCAIARLNIANGRREYLNATGAWTALPIAGALHFFAMRASLTDSLAFVFVVGPGQDLDVSTASWEMFDVVCLATCTVNGTPYGGSTIATVLGASNVHSKADDPIFDPTGLFR